MKQSDQIAPTGVDSSGARLRLARQSAGLTQEDVAARLHMPIRAVRALEDDDWSQAGAPVFVRGQLRSYARLLGVDLDLDALLPDPADATPPLVSHSHVPRYRHVLDHFTRRAVYIAITAVIVVPVWLATRPHLTRDLDVRSLDVAVAPAVPVGAGPQEPPAPRPQAQRTPVIASMAAMRAPVAEPGLSLAFSGDSWLQVFGPDGRSIEQGLLGAGERRSFEPGEVGQLVLGNVAAVEVRKDGKAVDLAPFSRANVARFRLSSDGSLAPVTH